MHKQFHVVVAAMPWVDTNGPLMAPAVLKSCLTRHNIPSVALDLNAEFVALLHNHPQRDQLKKFFFYETVSDDLVLVVREIFDQMADRILEYNPQWVALSLLTYMCQIATKWLCLLLKQRCPDIKIVIGGPGCFSSLKSIDTYAAQLKTQGLVDFYIVGDGEQAIVELVNGNDYPGINSSKWKEIQDLDSLPIPDFDDYQWHLYKEKKITIWGSRGCVRDCTFCDIHEHWDKFNWRSAENIFQEMLHQNKKYGVNQFHFTDSLVNGNQKEYRKLIKLLADFNQTQCEDQKIKWGGFFIFRQRDQMHEEDWQLTAESGAQILVVGVESFVEHIRHHIKKKFNNADLEYGLEMCKKYGLSVALLMIVGYVTETHEDHLEQLNWLKTHTHYANNPIKKIEFGDGLSVLPGTWLDRNKKELGLTIVQDETYQNWTNDQIQNTPAVRFQRINEIKQYAQDLGFSLAEANNNHELINEYLTEKFKQ